MAEPLPTFGFSPEFASLVASGAKRQTIRRLHGEPPHVGQALRLCRAGDPAPLLAPDPVCTACTPISIFLAQGGYLAVDLGGTALTLWQISQLANADGFDCWESFQDYFEAKRLPFAGVLITWAPRPVLHEPVEARECRTCRHDGKSIEEWPCSAAMNAAGLMCWEPKEVKP